MAEHSGSPELIRAYVTHRDPGAADALDVSVGILLKRSDDPHPAAAVVYHVLPVSYADANTDLRAGKSFASPWRALTC